MSGAWAPDNRQRKFRLYVQDQYEGLGSDANKTKFNLFIDAIGRTVSGQMQLNYANTDYTTDTYGNINILQMIIASNFAYTDFEETFKVDMGHDEL